MNIPSNKYLIHQLNENFIFISSARHDLEVFKRNIERLVLFYA